MFSARFSFSARLLPLLAGLLMLALPVRAQDLGIEILSFPANVNAGEDFLVQFQFSNAPSGDFPHAVDNASYTIFLSDGLEVGALPPLPPFEHLDSPDPQTLTYTIDQLFLSSILTRTFAFRATGGGPQTVTVMVTPLADDGNTSNDMDEVAINVAGGTVEADLALFLTGQVVNGNKTSQDDLNVVPGDRVRLGVTVTNNGPDDDNAINELVVNLGILAQPDLESVDNCNGQGTPDLSDPNAIKWTTNALPNATSVQCVVDFVFEGVGITTITATVTSNNDPNLNNNDDDLTINIQEAAGADLTVTKKVISDSTLLGLPPDSTYLGLPLTYEVTVTNNGPNDATNVRIIDVVSTDSLELTPDIEYDNCTATENGGTIECTESDLIPGESTTFRYLGFPKATGTVTNTVVVESDVEDPNLEDNVAQARAVVLPKFDYSVTKNVIFDNGDSTVHVGDTLTYQVLVTNLGPVRGLPPILLDSALKDSLEFLPMASPENCSMEPDSQDGNGMVRSVLSCTGNHLPVGATDTLTYKAKVKKAGVVTNHVQLFFLLPDSNPENNAAQVQVFVQAKAIAYGDPNALTPGVLDDPNQPFLSIQNALDAGATEVFLVPGTFDGNLFISGQQVTFSTWNGLTGNDMQTHVPGEVTVEGNVALDGPGSHVEFQVPVTIQGDLFTTNTDDPNTPDFVEGLSLDAPVFGGEYLTTVTGDWTSEGDVGVRLGSSETSNHNLGLEGNLNFSKPPNFLFENSDNLFLPDLCEEGPTEMPGNKVVFTGEGTSIINSTGTLAIPSVQINKEEEGAVLLDPNGDRLEINTSLEVIRGTFVTNGLLDANGGNGATVTIQDGILDKGDAPRVYFDANGEPIKVRYTGSRPHFTGDEIPDDGGGLTLEELEIFTQDSNTIITVTRDVTITDRLILTQGILDIADSELRLGNNATVEIGDGEIKKGESGGFVFPAEWLPDLEPGIDGIDLLYFGTTDRTVGLEWPSGRNNPGDVSDAGLESIRNVQIIPSCDKDVTVSLRDDDKDYRINGNFIVRSGSSFNLFENQLEINTPPDPPRTETICVVIDELLDGECTLKTDPDAAAAPRASLRQAIQKELAALQQHFLIDPLAHPSEALFPALAAYQQTAPVNEANCKGKVRFMGSGTLKVLSEFGTATFPIVEIDKEGGFIEFQDETSVQKLSLKHVRVIGREDFNVADDVVVEEDASLDLPIRRSKTGDQEAPALFVGGNLTLENGQVEAANLTVLGNLTMGPEQGTQPGSSTLMLAPDGFLTVGGNLVVGPDASADAPNQLALRGGTAMLFGDFTFLGSGDPLENAPSTGLDGTVAFLGNRVQHLRQRPETAAALSDVVANGPGGLRLLADVHQHPTATLQLARGVIKTDGWNWTLRNPSPDADFASSNVASSGSVLGGAAGNHLMHTLQRPLAEAGNKQDATAYVFPVSATEDLTHPLLLQLDAAPGTPVLTTVTALSTDTAPALDFAPFEVPHPENGSTILLNAVSPVLWQVTHDQGTPLEAAVRVQADGLLPAISDITGLRLVQWNCDGTTPRLAGSYPEAASPFVVNGVINDAPTITQLTVTLETCSLLGIASDGTLNPIDQPLTSEPVPRTQFLNLLGEATPVDLLIDNAPFVQTLPHQSATAFLPMPTGTLDVAVQTGAPVFSFAFTPQPDQQALLLDTQAFVNEDARRWAADPAMVDMNLFADLDASTLGDLRIRFVPDDDTAPPVILTDGGLAPRTFSDYVSLPPVTGIFELESLSTNTLLDFLVLGTPVRPGATLTGIVQATANKQAAFALHTFTSDGARLDVASSTHQEDATQPVAFALHGNYPNPFNPQTTIRFTLPQSADVRLRVFDALGREVATLVEGRIQPGTHAVSFDANDHASGFYFYRLEADDFQASQSMLLVK